MSASVLRYWRESASLILVGKASCLAASSSNPTTHVQSQNSTNITSSSSSNDYKILMLQRSSKMSFFPNFYVFPGGAADESDFSSEWLDILGPTYKLRTGCSYSPKETLFRLFSQESENNQRASIFSRKRDPKYSVIPSDIAFRICAIRETFEETGILLARKAEPEILEEEKHSDDKEERTRRRCTAKLYNLPEEELNKWRQSVLKSSDNFLKMCRDLSIVPDLTTLSEWSNWLTPISAKSDGRKPKRFNTIFFISFVDHLPQVMIETQEATNFKWQSPSEYFSQMMSGCIHLGPPQLYELNYMNFSNWKAFHDDVESHPYFHAQQWMPIRANCKDGLLFVFPGDDKYPKDVNLEELKQNFEFPMNKQEFFNSNHLNNHFDLEEFEFKRNFPFSKFRAQPLKNSTIEKLIKSKL